VAYVEGQFERCFGDGVDLSIYDVSDSGPAVAEITFNAGSTT